MFFYLTTYAISILLLYISKLIKTKRIRTVLIIIAILIPSILAGGRDVGVGRDTKSYMRNAFIWAQTMDFGSYISRFRDSQLFYTAWYFLSRISNSIFWPFFASEFLIELLFCISIREYSKTDKNNLWLGMAVYYFVFNSYSLSLTRQFISMALLLYGYIHCLREGKYKQYIFIGVIATGIQTFSAVFIIIALVYKFLGKILLLKRLYRIAIYSLTVAIIGVAIYLSSSITDLLTAYDIKYAYYQNNFSTFQDTFKSWVVFVGLTCILYYANKITNSKKPTLFESYMLFIGLASFWVNIFANNAYRMSFFFLVFLLPLLGNSMCKFNHPVRKSIKRNRTIISFFTLLFLFIVWRLFVVEWKMNDVIPYYSSLFGIY